MIKVIDSVMGSGKTQGIFQYMKENPDRKYLYISVFLDEVGDGNTGKEGRIQKELPKLKFKTPKNVGEGKIGGLKQLIKWGCNISSTHALFHIFDNEIVDLLVENKYVLIIDEAVECISKYKGVNKDDITLLKNTAISVDDKGMVRWNEDICPEHKGAYEEVRNLSYLGNLFVFNDKCFMWQYPPRLLEDMDEIFVLTYLFEGSMMCTWLGMNSIDWCYEDISNYGIRDESVIKDMIREKLHVIKNSRICSKLRKGRFTFSATAYKNANKDQLKQVSNAFASAVNMYKERGVFWTVYKGDDGKTKEAIQGKGFTLPDPDTGLDPFLPFNTKATNNYRNYDLCLYGVNPNKDPDEVKYIKERGGKFDNDLFALSEMLQFLWRGCIRKGEPMKVLIMSERMERLLEGWLSE